MFRGSSFHTIDAKGRFIVPTRFRDVIRASGHDCLVISRMDGCLFAYTLDEWTKLEKKILHLPSKSEAMRRFARLFIGSAHEQRCDGQGRVLIPAPLKQYAELDKEIVLAGVIDRFEIWSKEKWDHENDKNEADLSDEAVRQEIAQLGI